MTNNARPYAIDIPPRSLDDLIPQSHYELLNTLVTLSSQVHIPPELCSHVLWHKDLHAKNILVTDTAPPSITLIDWQSVSVGPLFQQATFALFAQYHGDSRIDLFNDARLPDGFDALPWHERIYLKHQRRLALRHLYYSSKTEQRSVEAQNWSRKVHLRSAIDESSRTWDLGLGPLREHLTRLADASGIKLPCNKGHPRAQEYKDRVVRLYKELEVEGDGWVPKERYEDVCALNEERRQAWNEVIAGGPYPIAHGAPSWFVDP